jgi:hypothetical protein
VLCRGKLAAASWPRQRLAAACCGLLWDDDWGEHAATPLLVLTPGRAGSAAVETAWRWPPALRRLALGMRALPPLGDYT